MVKFQTDMLGKEEGKVAALDRAGMHQKNPGALQNLISNPE
jgi:hypothetical protein